MLERYDLPRSKRQNSLTETQIDIVKKNNLVGMFEWDNHDLFGYDLFCLDIVFDIINVIRAYRETRVL